MSSPPKPPPIPAQRQETIRQRIVELLWVESLTPREISALVGIREREVARHLEHIRQSLHGGEVRLEVEAATCRKCGFVFVKRERLDRPGRCPVCKGESISEPRFSIRGGGEG